MNSKLYTGYEHIQQKKKIIIENILVEFGGARPKYVVVELPYIQVNEFLKTPSYHYVNFTNRTQSNF